MRVLMISRPTHYSSPGGDTVQLECTAEFLRKLGVEIDISLGAKPADYHSYDLLHFFNIIRPGTILPHIRRSGKPFVVSTIYVEYTEYERSIQEGIGGFIRKILPSDVLDYLKVLARRIKNGEPIGSLQYLCIGHRASIKYVANRASMLLPNSNSEYNRLAAKYGIKTAFVPIPNAIHSSIFSDAVQPNWSFIDAIVCVARIEGLKNQLNLIKAMHGLDMRLFVIGQHSPNHVAYYQECRNVAGTNVTFIEHLPQQELSGIYKAARVHAMPSWFETTGLSSLEAAAMGCNIVISDKGDQREYFKDFAFYCDPGNIDSIRRVVIKAYHAQRNQSFAKYIKNNFIWEKTAEKTLDAYNSILRKSVDK